MSNISEVTIPRDERGNDPNDFRDVSDYLEGLKPGYSVVNTQGKVVVVPAFGFRPLSQIREALSGPRYLIKPILERSTTNVTFGESGCYKSFLALDIGLSIAFGVDFHGYRTHQGPVFYICGEGHGGIGRRIEAWLIHHNLTGKDAPFYVSELPAQLINEGGAEVIAEVISGLCERHGNPVLIIIDTLSTNMGDGEENSNADVSRLLNNVNIHLRERFDACVLIVHHVGHGDKDRERGAYALRGNTDARMLVKAESGYSCSLHSLKMKDGPPFEPVAFRTVRITIPEITDSEGEPVTSLVLEKSEYVDASAGKKLPEQMRGALAVLQDMYQTERNALQGEGYDPSAAGVETKDWYEKLRALGLVKEDASRQALHKIKQRLTTDGLARVEGAHIFPVLETSPDDSSVNQGVN
jgi:hypothetical protein